MQHFTVQKSDVFYIHCRPKGRKLISCTGGSLTTEPVQFFIHIYIYYFILKAQPLSTDIGLSFCTRCFCSLWIHLSGIKVPSSAFGGRSSAAELACTKPTSSALFLSSACENVAFIQKLRRRRASRAVSGTWPLAPIIWEEAFWRAALLMACVSTLGLQLIFMRNREEGKKEDGVEGSCG